MRRDGGDLSTFGIQVSSFPFNRLRRSKLPAGVRFNAGTAC